MKSEIINKEITETKQPMTEGFKNIKPEKPMSFQDIKNFWKEEFKNISEPFNDKLNEKNEIKEWQKEKIEFAAHSKGEWSGKAGDSEFVPSSEEARNSLKKYDQQSIKYENGNPDFSKVSETTVQIDSMTADRSSNFRQAREAIAKKWNEEGRDNKTDWKPRDVEHWQRENKYTLHECADRRTMNLVPTAIHDECKHYGGVAECKHWEKDVKFDE